MSDEPTMLEHVARAIALAHFAKRARSPKPDYLAGLVDRQWHDFEPDARLVIETINRLVELEDATSDLPTLPNWLTLAAAQ